MATKLALDLDLCPHSCPPSYHRPGYLGLRLRTVRSQPLAQLQGNKRLTLHPYLPGPLHFRLPVPAGPGLRCAARQEYDSSHWTLPLQRWHAHLLRCANSPSQGSCGYSHPPARRRSATNNTRHLGEAILVPLGMSLCHRPWYHSAQWCGLEALSRICMDNLQEHLRRLEAQAAIFDFPSKSERPRRQTN